METCLRLLYTHGVCQGRFPFEKLVEVTSTNRAKIFNLYPQKGTIAVGSDADLVIYDERGSYKIDAKNLQSKTHHSLYDGVEVLGKPVMTIVRGQVVVEDGQLLATQPFGQLLRRPSYSIQ